MAYDQHSQYQPPQRDYLASRNQPAPYGGYDEPSYGDQQHGQVPTRKPVGYQGIAPNSRADYGQDNYNQGAYDYNGGMNGQAQPQADYGYGQYDQRRPAKSTSIKSNNSGRSPGSSGYGTPSPAYPPRKESYDSPRDLNRAMGDLSVSGYGQSVSQQRRPGTSNSNRSNGSRNQGYDQGYSNQYGLRADHFQESRTAATSPARGGFQPERSMTMPTEIGNRPHRQNSDRGPYERSQSDRQYGPRPPADRQFGPQRSQPGHGYPQPYVEKHENFELLDSYYGNTNQPFINGQQQSPEEEMPNFDIAQKPHKRGASIDKHLNESGTRYEGRGDFGAQTHRSRSQPDLRGQARGPPKDAPQMPGYDQPQYDPAYGNGPRGRGPMPRGGPNMRGPNGRGRPPPAMRGGPPRGLPHPARGGPPGRDARNGPQRSPLAGQPNGRNPDGLPQHPASVRPGLVQGPPVNQDRKDQPPEQAADQSSSIPVTYKELEDLKQSAAQHPNDRKLQLQLAKKWVEAASVLADEGGRADARTTRANREKYILDAHKLIKKLVAGGSSEAMFYLADCYGQGALGLEPDNREAFKLYQSAAKLGHPQAAYRTAVCCEMGPEDGGGTNKDPLKAVEWYKRSAAMGDTPAMYKMGMIQLKGLLGQPKNPREAVVWLKRAADRADADNPHALHELGLLCQNASPNDSIIKDEAYARQLFFQAAELGYKFSQFRLGAAHEFGSMGCPVDPRTSIAWYSRAAVQEEHQSALALSGWYLTGAEGILAQSDTEAYLWARKAAQAGLSKAEYAMGYFTEVGIGCPPNLEEAKRWYQRAAGQNFPKARERLDELRRGGVKAQKTRERLSRSKQKEGDCVVM